MIKPVVPELVREPWKKVRSNTFFLDFSALFVSRQKGQKNQKAFIVELNKSTINFSFRQ